MVVQEFDDQINVFRAIEILMKEKILIIVVTAIFAVSSIIYSLLVTETYSSKTVLVLRTDVVSDISSRSAGLGSLGGLASSLTGLSGVGVSSSRKDYVLTRLTSLDFFEQYIFDEVAPEIFATKSWDYANKRLIYNSELYDEKTSRWQTDDMGRTLRPSSELAHRDFLGSLSLSDDKKTGFISMQFSSISPVLSHKVVELMVSSANREMHVLDKKSAEETLMFLRNTINQESDIEIRDVLYSLLSDQLIKLAFTNLSDEYFLLPVVPAKVPERRSYPSRSIIVILSTLFGGILSCCFVVIRSSYLRDGTKLKI